MLSRRVFYFGSSLVIVIFFVVYLASENLKLFRIQPWIYGFEQNEAESAETITATIPAVFISSMPTAFTYTTKERTTKERTTKATTKPTPPVSTLQPENYDLNRTLCSTKFSGGLMCPKLYTELGGHCLYNQSTVTCKDVRRKAFHNLRQAQLTITRLLGVFELVARKHNITYWLTSGTLLGAARHKGFIPWDADADIEIPLDEYEKFYRIASRDLPASVFFQNSESDSKLRPSNPKEYEELKYKDIGLYRRSWNPRLRDVKSCYKYCIAHGCKWHDGMMVDIFVVESVPKGTLPLKEVLFEGLRFPIQNNWREILADKYGNNFMEIPKDGSKTREQTDNPDPLHSCQEIRERNN